MERWLGDAGAGRYGEREILMKGHKVSVRIMEDDLV
jgi:hypothetical protein